MYGITTTLGMRISQLRQDRGWTQKELASKAGITQNHVSRIEKDRMQPRRSTLTAIAKSFEIELEDLEALAQVPEKNIEERIAKDDPDLAVLVSQIPLLSTEQKNALRVTLRSMVSYQKNQKNDGSGRIVTRQDLIQRIQELPEDAPLENLEAALETIRFKIRVDRGLRQAERGETVPHEEVEKMIDGWLEE